MDTRDNGRDTYYSVNECILWSTLQAAFFDDLTNGFADGVADNVRQDPGPRPLYWIYKELSLLVRISAKSKDEG